MTFNRLVALLTSCGQGRFRVTEHVLCITFDIIHERLWFVSLNHPFLPPAPTPFFGIDPIP
jgi:hypothetical protein